MLKSLTTDCTKQIFFFIQLMGLSWHHTSNSSSSCCVQNYNSLSGVAPPGQPELVPTPLSHRSLASMDISSSAGGKGALALIPQPGASGEVRRKV